MSPETKQIVDIIFTVLFTIFGIINAYIYFKMLITGKIDD